MIRRPRPSRDSERGTPRLEPRFAVERAPAERHSPAADEPAPPQVQHDAEPPARSANSYALPDHVIPSWVAESPQAPPQAAPAPAEPAERPQQQQPTWPDSPAAARGDAAPHGSHWSRIHVPDEERDRAAKAGLYRYVKETPERETSRPRNAAPPRAVAGDGKPRIWLTVIALLALFGAGAYGLSWLAQRAQTDQSAEWRPADAPEPPAPPAAAPNPAPAPAPRFIEVAP